MNRLRPLFIAVAALATGACSVSPRQVMGEQMMRMKPASLAAWEAAGHGDKASLRAVARHTAVLLGDGRELGVRASFDDSGELSDFTFLSNNSDAVRSASSSAVPITEDGYFLTARHCVRGPALTLFANTQNADGSFFDKAPARVVWTSSKRIDLAIVHADVRPARVFELAQREQIRVGGVVTATGWSGIVAEDKFAGMAAGKVIAVSELITEASGLRWFGIEHDVPLNGGDSGGPLFDRVGHIAGINSRVEAGLLAIYGPRRSDRALPSYRAFAALPDREWLLQTIAIDRKARSSR